MFNFISVYDKTISSTPAWNSEDYLLHSVRFTFTKLETIIDIIRCVFIRTCKEPQYFFFNLTSEALQCFYPCVCHSWVVALLYIWLGVEGSQFNLFCDGWPSGKKLQKWATNCENCNFCHINRNKLFECLAECELTQQAFFNM